NPGVRATVGSGSVGARTAPTTPITPRETRRSAEVPDTSMLPGAHTTPLSPGEPSGPAARRLGVLSEAAGACTLCGLHAQRSTAVFGEGSPTADVVVVGEAPGQEEDRTGRPFVGRAGKLLDLLLASAGFPRPEV